MNGYSSKRFSALLIPTRFIKSTAILRASIRSTPWCFTITSVICEPIVRIGFKEVIGSWKIVAIFLPRISSQSLSEVFSNRFLPSKMILPCGILPFFSNIPVNVFVNTDLPEPDSPTIARVSPS